MMPVSKRLPYRKDRARAGDTSPLDPPASGRRQIVDALVRSLGRAAEKASELRPTVQQLSTQVDQADLSKTVDNSF